MSFNRRLMLAVAAVALCGFAAQAKADLKFGVAAEPYAPFTSKDASGKWVGWEIDLMDAVCAQMKEKCELVEVAWDGIIPSLTAKQIDVIWSSMSITADRKKSIEFTKMYYNTPTVIIGQKDGDTDISPEHLKGKTIGVQVTTIHQKYVEKYFGAGSTIKTYQTQDEANNDLAAGRLDYVQADGSALDTYLKTDQGAACCELKGAVPEDAEILGEGVGGGIRKEDTELKAKLDAAIDALAKSGEINKITEKYPELVGKMILPQ
ncbi:transporter substrate-binding domain-containing protein [Taklimakanibacter lacteus]|uniref:transporter substrate-binding domain-containing protein n=1 Tax=Taklimakanibacter lacteus TaxID=2268456 RepID=UPI003F685B3A